MARHFFAVISTAAAAAGMPGVVAVAIPGISSSMESTPSPSLFLPENEGDSRVRQPRRGEFPLWEVGRMNSRPSSVTNKPKPRAKPKDPMWPMYAQDQWPTLSPERNGRRGNTFDNSESKANTKDEPNPRPKEEVTKYAASRTTAAAVPLSTLDGLTELSFSKLQDVLRSCGGNSTATDYFISVLVECHNYKQRNSLPDHAPSVARSFANLCLSAKRFAEKQGADERQRTSTKPPTIPTWPEIRCVESFCFQNSSSDTTGCAGLQRSTKNTPDFGSARLEELPLERSVKGNSTYAELMNKLKGCNVNSNGKNSFINTLDACYNREVSEHFSPAIQNFTEMILNYCSMSATLAAAERGTKVFTYQNKRLAADPDWRAMRGCLVVACRGPSTPKALMECATQDTSEAWWSLKPPQRPDTLPLQYGKNDLAGMTMGIENATYSALLTGLRSCLGDEQQRPQLIRRIDDWYAIERSTSRQDVVHRFALLLNKYCLVTKITNALSLPENFDLKYENQTLAREPNWYAIERCIPWASYSPDYKRLAFCASPEKSRSYWNLPSKKFHSSVLSLNSSNLSNVTAAEIQATVDASSERIPWWGVLAVTGAASACLVAFLVSYGRRREHNKQRDDRALPLVPLLPGEA